MTFNFSNKKSTKKNKYLLDELQEDLTEARMSTIQCYGCSQFGHRMRNCPTHPGELRNSQDYWQRKREKDAKKRQSR